MIRNCAGQIIDFPSGFRRRIPEETPGAGLLSSTSPRPGRQRGNMRKMILLLVIIFVGCQEDAPSHNSFGADHPFVNMKLISVEGGGDDQWEIWGYNADPNIRILCHHSGFTGSYGGRSTSCVAVQSIR